MTEYQHFSGKNGITLYPNRQETYCHGCPKSVDRISCFKEIFKRLSTVEGVDQNKHRTIVPNDLARTDNTAKELIDAYVVVDTEHNSAASLCSQKAEEFTEESGLSGIICGLDGQEYYFEVGESI